MKKGIALCLLVLLISTAFADEYHYINLFIGDRAAGLGGAYTAIADGPEGVYYNPAGLAYSSAVYFSLSVNAIQWKQTKYLDIFDNENALFDYTRSSLSIIPNFFGFVQKMDNMTFALTVAVPENEFYEQRDTVSLPLSLTNSTTGGQDQVTQNLQLNFNLVNTLYEVGGTLAFLPIDRLSIGFGLNGYYREYKDVFQIFATYNFIDIIEMLKNQFYNISTIGLKPQVGIQYMPIDQLSIGYAASFSMPLVGWERYQVSNMTSYGDISLNPYNIGEAPFSNNHIGGNIENFLNVFSDGFFEMALFKQGLGIAWFINQETILSLDGYLYIPVEDSAVPDLHKRQIVGNGAFGIEWYITPNIPVRAGIYTNFSNTPVIDPEKLGQLEHIDQYGGTFSIGFADASSTINVGLCVFGGVGEAQMLDGYKIVQTAQTIGFSAFLSGGYQF